MYWNDIIPHTSKDSTRISGAVNLKVTQARYPKGIVECFCEVICSTIKIGCTTVQGTGSIWNENLYGEINSPNDTLVVRMWGKEKKSQFRELGSIEVDLKYWAENEKSEWLTLKDKQSNVVEGASVFVTLYVQLTPVLPREAYTNIIKIICSNKGALLSNIGNSVSKTNQNLIAKSIIEIALTKDFATVVLENIIMNELKLQDPKKIFTEETVGSIALLHFLLIPSKEWVISALKPAIEMICKADNISCEVILSLLGHNEDYQKNLQHLTIMTSNVLFSILNSQSSAPALIRYTLRKIKKVIETHLNHTVQNQKSLVLKALGRIIMSKFFTMILTEPTKYKLLEYPPNLKTARNLSLIGQVIERLGCSAQFSDTEAHLDKLNNFLVENTQSMKDFVVHLCRIEKDTTNPTTKSHRPVISKEAKANIDFYRAVARVTKYCVENMHLMPKEESLLSELEKLKPKIEKEVEEMKQNFCMEMPEELKGMLLSNLPNTVKNSSSFLIRSRSISTSTARIPKPKEKKNAGHSKKETKETHEKKKHRTLIKANTISISGKRSNKKNLDDLLPYEPENDITNNYISDIYSPILPSGELLCYVCRKKIPSSVAPLSTVNRYYHPECFKCSKCGISMLDIPFFAHQNDVFCTDCYSSTT